MPVTRFEILRREPLDGGRAFGAAGAYERIDGIAHYSVDPDHPANAGITDLGHAERDAEGRVRFDGDVTLLVPVDAARANGALLVEVPNRGNRVALRSFNRAPFELMPTDDIDPGDGYLMRHGWCVAFVGWQWDMPDCVERLGLRPPHVPPERRGVRTQMQLRIQPDAPTATFTLTDHHVGAIGNHAPIPPDDADDPHARLLVRDTMYGDAATLERSRWRFETAPGAAADAPATRVTLDGGFQPGRIYDVLYTPRECPVGAAGLLAVRDFAAFARDGADSPVAGTARHVIGEGISQCGRFLRTLLHLGLNVDEGGRQVFDGVLAHIAGGRRGEFNQRYGQPSVQPTPAFGHLFPFADLPQKDPRRGGVAGLLDRLRERNALPRIVYTDTSSEYWRGDAALAHTHLADNTDAEPPPEVRRYLFASTQHGPGILPFANESVFGTRGANSFNVVDYRPLFRAALENLRRWIADGTEPPPSRFPRRADGTAATREAVMQALSAIDGLVLPDAARLPSIIPLDFGDAAARGIGRFPAQPTGASYPTVVSAVDDNGNETGGVRMPDVDVPVAVHTGFNPRHPSTGGNGQILEYVGSTVVREACVSGYSDRDTYLEAVRDSAHALVAERLLLEEDIEVCVDIAAERYDAAQAVVRAGSARP